MYALRRADELSAALSPVYSGEREYTGAEGTPKHWHVYRQIRQRPPGPAPRPGPGRTETSGHVGTDYHHQRFW